MVQKTITLIFLFVSSFSYAECDWKTITKTSEGYLYNRECHIEVGKSLEELDIRRNQVELLKKSSDLYQQALSLEQQRSDIWYKQAQSLEKKIGDQKVYSDLEKVGYFALGVLVMYGAVQAVSK